MKPHPACLAGLLVLAGCAHSRAAAPSPPMSSPSPRDDPAAAGATAEPESTPRDPRELKQLLGQEVSAYLEEVLQNRMDLEPFEEGSKAATNHVFYVKVVAMVRDAEGREYDYDAPRADTPRGACLVDIAAAVEKQVLHRFGTNPIHRAPRAGQDPVDIGVSASEMHSNQYLSSLYTTGWSPDHDFHLPETAPPNLVVEVREQSDGELDIRFTRFAATHLGGGVFQVNRDRPVVAVAGFHSSTPFPMDRLCGAPGSAEAPASSDSVAPARVATRFDLAVGNAENPHSTVNPDHVFHPGDSVWIDVQANRHGHVYLLNIGPAGDVNLLVPSSRVRDTAIQAGRVRHLGPFDVYEPLGEERLELLYSPHPIAIDTLKAELIERWRVGGRDAADDILRFHSVRTRSIVAGYDPPLMQMYDYTAPQEDFDDGGFIWRSMTVTSAPR